jgi:hypothetical protein
MRIAGILLLLTALPGNAQFAAPPGGAQAAARPAASAAPIQQPGIPLDAIRTLERAFDAKIASVRPEPMNVMGAARGLYLPGYGLVFTAELDLAMTPAAGGLFRREFSAAERTAIHDKKLAQVPVLEQLMREMVAASAQKADTMPDSERVVLAVRIWCQAFEDRTGLPNQILMAADRKSAISGHILEVATR